MSRNSIRLTFFFACFIYSFGAVEIRDGGEEFPPDSVLVDFRTIGHSFRWYPEGFDPNKVAPDWGVSFSGNHPVLRHYVGMHTYAGVETRLSNPAISGPSRPLIVDFVPAVQRAGLSLVSLAGEERVRVSAFSSEGKQLGTATRTFGPLPGPDASFLASYLFLAFHSTAEPISKLTVEYTAKNGDFSEDQAETLREVLLHREAERRFTTYVPQFIQGRLGSDTIFQSELVFLNVSNSTGQADVRFFDHQGQPLNVEIFGDSTSNWQWREETPLMQMTGNYTPPISGYCSITSRSPAQVSIRIRKFDSAGVLSWEMETPATPATTRASAIASCQKVIERRQTEPMGIESAIAIANVSGEIAHVKLFWAPVELGGANEAIVELAPGARLAKFISEIYPELFAVEDEDRYEFDISGDLELVSDQPVAVAVFRTAGGFPAVASPAAIYESRR